MISVEELEDFCDLLELNYDGIMGTKTSDPVLNTNGIFSKDVFQDRWHISVEEGHKIFNEYTHGDSEMMYDPSTTKEMSSSWECYFIPWEDIKDDWVLPVAKKWASQRGYKIEVFLERRHDWDDFEANAYWRVSEIDIDPESEHRGSIVSKRAGIVESRFLDYDQFNESDRRGEMLGGALGISAVNAERSTKEMASRLNKSDRHFTKRHFEAHEDIYEIEGNWYVTISDNAEQNNATFDMQIVYNTDPDWGIVGWQISDLDGGTEIYMGTDDDKAYDAIQKFEAGELTTEAFEWESINEGFRDILQKVQDAIRKKEVCNIYYKGEISTSVLPGTRYIEPYAVGVSRDGNMIVRAWLIKGVSKTGKINPKLVPGWRIFKVNRIQKLDPTHQKFTTARKGYNPEDEHMKKIISVAKF